MPWSAGPILIDLSKAFDCLDRNLLIVKLAFYGLRQDALKLIKSNGSYSTYSNITIGVPQGQVLVKLLPNIFINNISLFEQLTNVCTSHATLTSIL